MAGTSMMRGRVAAVVVAVAVTAVALAACGGKGEPPGADPTGDSQVGRAPTASAGPTATAGASRPANGAPVYPKDARSYAQELLKAWAGPDYPRLGQLAIQSAVQQVRDSIDFGGRPNSQWTHIRCAQGDQPEFTDCVFRNAHGDEVTITLVKAQLGFPTAVTAAPLERTQYPDDPGSYVATLLSALANGNQQRVLRLSNNTVKNGLTCTISSTTTGQEAIDSTYTKVTVTGLSDDSGKMYAFKVLSQPGDKAGAVKEILSKTC